MRERGEEAIEGKERKVRVLRGEVKERCKDKKRRK